MGPFRRVPHMQCVHGIRSMDHLVDGAVELNGRTLWFDKGRGYWETDRGRSFPRRYLWTQCAWQERQRVSLMLAVARIPVGPGSFTGIISEIFYAGASFRLATYRGARVVRWGEDGAQGPPGAASPGGGGVGAPSAAPPGPCWGKHDPHHPREPLCRRPVPAVGGRAAAL